MKPVIWFYSHRGNPIDDRIEYAGCAWATGEVLLVQVFEDGELLCCLDHVDPDRVWQIRDAIARRPSVQRGVRFVSPHFHYAEFGVLTADGSRAIAWNEILQPGLAMGMKDDKARQLVRDWYDTKLDIILLVQGAHSDVEAGENLKQVLRLTGARSLEEFGTHRFWKRWLGIASRPCP